MCRAFSNNLLHEIITQSPALFSRSFQILYISAQVFKYFALFCPFLTFFVLFLKNYMYALLLLSIIFRISIYIYIYIYIYIKFTVFFIYFYFNIILHFILNFNLFYFFPTCFIMKLFLYVL